LIDTAGMAQRHRTRELMEMLSHRVISCSSSTLLRRADDRGRDDRLQRRSCRRLLQMDEAVKLGPAPDAVIRHGQDHRRG
jgi:hypothetical protein